MSRKRSGSAKHDSGQPSETRAERRARIHASRTVARALQREIADRREKRSRLIRGWIFKGLSALLFLVVLLGAILLKDKISDPSINLWGKVVDEQGRPIEGATVEWSTSRDGNLRRTFVGSQITNEWGGFRVYHKRLHGTGLTIHRVSAGGFRDLVEPRSFRYYKNPRRIVPDDDESSTFVLKRGRSGKP